jgi:hypothetical protein
MMMNLVMMAGQEILTKNRFNIVILLHEVQFCPRLKKAIPKALCLDLMTLRLSWIQTDDETS